MLQLGKEIDFNKFDFPMHFFDQYEVIPQADILSYIK